MLTRSSYGRQYIILLNIYYFDVLSILICDVISQADRAPYTFMKIGPYSKYYLIDILDKKHLSS